MNHLWRIEMFGGLRAVFNPVSTSSTSDGESRVIERFRTQKTAALLALLAFRRKAQAREVLADALWPENDPIAASQNLRTALSSLRRQLEPPGVPAGSVILSNRSSIQLNPQCVTSDVHEFESALQEGKNTFDVDFRIENYERAVAEYSGRLLPGFYEEWIMSEATRLEEEYFGALDKVIRHHESQSNFERARFFARMGARVDESREEVLDALERLAQSEDEEETPDFTPNVAVATKQPRVNKPRKTNGRKATPPSSQPSAAPARVSLPPQWTRFFGREREIERIGGEFHQHSTRLLTLTGPGGSGKTRLAIEAARRIARQPQPDEENEPWPQAVYFVALADIRDADLVAPAIVAALGLPRASEVLLSGNAPPESFPLERLVTALRARPTLLVLDNFEHVIAAAPLLETLLTRAPALKILVTSQHRLQVAGEREISVGALPTPTEDDEWEDIFTAPSTQLFVDRAQMARPDFQITRQNAPDIVRLCVALEGVPLALELAAARAGVLSAAQIAAQLEAARESEGGRLEFLKNSKQPATMRHLSLRTAIAWSYGLLPAELARFWTRLAVFRGSFLPDAAAQVCDQSDALHWLQQLRACSLLIAEEHDGAIRFRWSELLREFAEEQLAADSAQENAVRRRHAEYFCDALADGVLRLRTPDEAGALRQAALEADNARAALGWTQRAREYSLGAALALSLGTTLQRRGLHREASERLECGVDVSEHLSEEYDSLRASLLREAAGVHLDLMEWTHARRDADLLRRLCERSDDTKGWAEAINLLGLAAKSSRQWKKAREYFVLAAERFEEIGDMVGLANVRNNLGLIEYLDANGDKDAAGRYFHQALTLRWELNDARGVAEAFVNLGALAQQREEFDEARRYYSEALGMELRLHHIFGIGRALCNLGEVAEADGQAERAFRLYAAAHALFENAGIAYRKYSSERCKRLSTHVENHDAARETAQRYAADNEIEKLVLWAEA